MSCFFLIESGCRVFGVIREERTCLVCRIVRFLGHFTQLPLYLILPPFLNVRSLWGYG